MEKHTLDAEERENTGKGVARSLRRQGIIPAVIYKGGKSSPIQLQKKALVKFIRSTMGAQSMVSLKFPDGKSRHALMKDYQLDPARGELLHTDFFEVSLKQKVKVPVAVVLTGEPVGVKKEGGLLQQIVTEVEVECLANNIPAHLEIDVSEIPIGGSAHVSDIPETKGVSILAGLEEVVATVTAPAVAVEEEEVIEEAEEGAEPEVIGKGKKEEAGEEEED